MKKLLSEINIIRSELEKCIDKIHSAEQENSKVSITELKSLNMKAAQLISRSKKCQSELNSEYAKDFGINPDSVKNSNIHEIIVKVFY